MAIVMYVFAGLMGLVVGSFLNVVIYRVPIGESVVAPRSHCPKCGELIHWYDNIPVVSYILLGAKCRKCKCHISFRYTAVELLNMVLWVACLYFLVGSDALEAMVMNGNTVAHLSSLIYSVLCMVACSMLLCVAFVDLEHMIIPDRFQITLAVIGILAIANELVFGGTEAVLLSNTNIGWIERVIGCAAGGGLFLLIYFGGRLILKREAMGFGDVKLVAATGLIIGWQNLALSILAASVIGSIVLVGAQIANKKKERFREYPFAPFLAFGMIAAMLFGKSIIGWYISLIG